jgi:hypothetical protein
MYGKTNVLSPIGHDPHEMLDVECGTPGNASKTPFRGFHPFQVFIIFPIHANPWSSTVIFWGISG